MPPVLATAFLVALVERTCIEVLRPYLAAGLGTVGVHETSATRPLLLLAWKR
jgi:fluoroacetyl-CoA thioesterase